MGKKEKGRCMGEKGGTKIVRKSCVLSFWASERTKARMKIIFIALGLGEVEAAGEKARLE